MGALTLKWPLKGGSRSIDGCNSKFDCTYNHNVTKGTVPSDIIC